MHQLGSEGKVAAKRSFHTLPPSMTTAPEEINYSKD
jgi:hypothetical protein